MFPVPIPYIIYKLLLPISYEIKQYNFMSEQLLTMIYNIIAWP